MTTILTTIQEIAADVLEVAPNTVTSESSLASIATWDSLRHLNLLLALECQFGIRIGPAEIDSTSDIRAIAALVQQKVSDAEQMPERTSDRT
jgi:acyl carrier protein